MLTLRRTSVLVVVISTTACGGKHVQLTVSPRTSLVDDPVRVRVTGLQPGQKVILGAATVDLLDRRWRSRVAMKASPSGEVDTDGNMTLFRSMVPVKETAFRETFAPRDEATPMSITVRAGGRVVASTRILRRGAAEDLRREQLTRASDGLVGTYFARGGVRAAPAILQIGGSNGGHSQFPAALLASRGYPTLSLAYFGEPGVPRTLEDIPLEYFERALHWLGERPEVDARRITILGVSRGGEAALLLGATFPRLVHGVIACEPSATVLGAYPGPGTAWRYRGKPVPEQPIPIERIAGSVLVFGAGRDAIFDSRAAVRQILERARAHGRRNVIGHVFQDAGHGVGCMLPNVPLGGEAPIGPSTSLVLGGTPVANERAQSTAWSQILRFLRTR